MTWSKIPLYGGISITVFLLSAYLTITLLLTTGETVICPDVKGKTVAEAKKLAEDKGLSLSVTRYERRNDVPYNHITVQKPEANISIRKGRIVLVIVSEGPELVQIPSFTGKTAEDIEQILSRLNVGIEKTIYVPSQKVGKVIAQIPKGGEGVLQGKKGVTLFVGAEQKILYVMPDIRDLDFPDLSYELEKKGIKYRTTSIKGDRPLKSKAVLEASVPQRTIFKADDEIEIKVITGGTNE